MMYYQFTKDLNELDFYRHKVGDKLPVKVREGSKVLAVHDGDGGWMFDVNSLVGKHYGILVSYIEMPNIHNFSA